MTSATITVRVDDAELLGRLQELAARGGNLQPLFAKLGDELLESTRHRFQTRTGPDGEKWRPVSEEYALAKADGKVTSDPGDARTRNPADLLLLTHHLFDNLAYQAGTTNLVLGSPEVYAATHQFGRGPIAARPFLGFSEDDRRMVLAEIGDWMDQA